MASSRFGCHDGLTLAARMRDRRAWSRLRIARLVQVAHDGDAAYARCRDLSDIGLKLDLTAPLELNTRVTVALSHSILLCGTVAWINGRECGVAFDSPIDSEALLAAAEPATRRAEAPTTAELLGARQAVSGKPSPHHHQPRPGAIFQAGLAVTVMVGPDREQRGVLRWTHGNIAALDLEPADEEEEAPAPYGLLTGPEMG